MGRVIHGRQKDSLEVGGRTIIGLSSVLQLAARVDSGGSASQASFRLPNGTAGYAVPANFQMRVLAIRAIGADADATVGLRYSDNDCGVASNTSPTNAVNCYGSASIDVVGYNSAMSGQRAYEAPLDFVVPAGKYLGVNKTGNLRLIVWARLEAV